MKAFAKVLFLNQGKSVRVDALNDHKDFNHVKHALDVCDFTAQEQEVTQY